MHFQEAFADLARACNVRVISWRKLSTNRDVLGEEAKKTEPLMRQVSSVVVYSRFPFHSSVKL